MAIYGMSKQCVCFGIHILEQPTKHMCIIISIGVASVICIPYNHAIRFGG